MSLPASTERRANLDPITVEVIGSALSSIVEETGEALIRASYSTNIKERRDCSTALFNVQGQTLCQAEHIPIHLGSFIGIVSQVLKQHAIADMRPGDVFVGNDATGAIRERRDVWMAEQDANISCPIYERDRLRPGNRFTGPAVIEQMDATTLVLPDMKVRVDPYLNLILEAA